ncbi:unnamed protein product, partial [Musa hybrid cultivar]
IFLCFRVYDGGHHPAALPPAELNTASDRRWKVPRGGGSVDWSPPLPSFCAIPLPTRPLAPREITSRLLSLLTSNSRRRPHPEKLHAAAHLGFRRLVPPEAPISGICLALDFDLPFRVFDCGSDLVFCSPIHGVSGGALRGF